MFRDSTSGYLQMKGRKYGTVVCEGGQSSGGHDGVYGERKRVGRGLKEQARGREKIERSTEMDDTK